MTHNYSTTISEERKRGQHLRSEERSIIQVLKKLGYSNRAIARELGCSPSTVGYELKRGTPEYSEVADLVIQQSVVPPSIIKTGAAADAPKQYRETQSSFDGWLIWCAFTNGPSILAWAEQDG